MPLAMKFQISNEKSQIFPYTTQSCNAWGKLVATYKVAASLFCAAQSLFRSILECCGDSGSNTPNDQPDWNLNFKKRLGWLPRQARPSLHGGRRPTWNKCHWTWKFKSTMRIPELPQHKPGSAWENWWLPTTSQLHFFALHSLYLRPFYTMAAGSCPKIAILVQPPLLAEILTQICQIQSTAWKNNFWTLPLQLHCMVADVKLNQMPQVMKCHINNEKRSSSTHTWIPLRNWRLPTTSQLALHNLYLGPCLTMIAGSCLQVEILVQPPLL